ncbi:MULTISPECIES: xanthine dehydrogenase family protein molybdopterin-binding subunit [Streptomyces]|uniref:xanthine dehydrogenase family protein molybdopterin-binding subunit n=1 Tax=Streptomyces TaxID=1883 RepID=UPI001907663D|nr:MULTISPECIES: molybdopterin cofactor-binding domain-containing protein [unclassified Streptomyces]MCU4746712.1 molybdopterin-dependent oxidoreductase [Streptomyces sp. G-5]QQN77429.1 molybdopterin-dependent oxidoreductase [Streptomyces sp. XC 2026]
MSEQPIDGITAVTVAGAEPAPGPAEGAPALGLGASVPPADAAAKTTGVYPYTADLWAEGLLWAAVLRAPHPRARIRGIDTSEAAALPGVRAVVTHLDVGGTPPGDRPPLAADEVRYHGEPVAAVAADHPETARLAAAAIAVEYEVLPPVTDPEKVFEAEPLHPDGNIIRHIPLRHGDPNMNGEIVVEGVYRIGRQDPAPIGAEAGLAVPRPDGGVEVYTGSTDPHGDRDRLAACLGLEQEQVKVYVTGVPGAFGDREDLGFELPLALLAIRTASPVKLAATREESFLGHPHRHPTMLRYWHHADREGKLVKVEAQLLMDAGAYADGSAEALAAAVSFAAGPYRVPNAVVDGWAVRTNNPPSGHLRGEGALQVCAAYEGQMDKLAVRLGLDPAEVRARNVLSTGDPLPTGQAVTCPAPVAELLRAVRESPLPPPPDEDWVLPGGPDGAADPGAVRRGVGYALGMVHMLGAEGADEVSTATVKVEGSVATVLCAAVETGQGFATLARQIVQEVLGVEEVHVAPVDTDQPPAGPGLRGRNTWVSGGAVERAAKMVRTQLLQPLAATFGMSAELLTIADGKITSYDGVLSTTVAEALEGKELWATAQCRPHPTEPLNAAGQGDAFVGLAFAAVRAVVDVDVELGSVRVVEMAIAQDVGRILNPAQLRARIEAGVTQGVGTALMEHLRVARGVVRRPDFADYALPTALDVPEIRIVKLLEERDVVAPFGAKAAGAAPVVVSPAAVAAAVRAATGRPVNRLPIRPQSAVVTAGQAGAAGAAGAVPGQAGVPA